MLRFLDNSSIAIIIEPPPRNRDFFTNEDSINGNVLIKTKQKISIKTLTVYFNVSSTIILLDQKGTFLTCENRHIFTVSKILPISNNIIKTNTKIPFTFTIPGEANSEKNFNLPPSLKYIDGINQNIKIDYSIDAIVEKNNSKSSMNDNILFKFSPSPQFTSYSLLHNSVLPNCITEAPFSFKYNYINNNLMNYNTNNNTDLRKKNLSLMRFSRKLNTELFDNLKDIEFPFTLQIEFSHTKLLQGKFSKGVINIPDSLKESINLYFISQYSSKEIYSKLYQKPMTESLNYPEKITVSSLKIDLVSVVSFCCGKKILKDTRSRCLLDKSTNLDYSVDLEKFHQIKTKKGGIFYRYEIDPVIFDCVIRNDVCSFISSSVKMDHQLQITMELRSGNTKNNSNKVLLCTDILILNDLFDYD